MKLKSFPAADRLRIKNEILGKDYELSLVFANAKLSRQLNATYRGKDMPTNVLAFPLSKNSGEIFIDTTTAKREAKDFGMAFEKFVKFLFIHALLHLKGTRHSARMRRLENKFLNETLNRSGH